MLTYGLRGMKLHGLDKDVSDVGAPDAGPTDAGSIPRGSPTGGHRPRVEETSDRRNLVFEHDFHLSENAAARNDAEELRKWLRSSKELGLDPVGTQQDQQDALKAAIQMRKRRVRGAGAGTGTDPDPTEEGGTGSAIGAVGTRRSRRRRPTMPSVRLVQTGRVVID